MSAAATPYVPIGPGFALEVPEPILCSPYDEPGEHWDLFEGEAPKRAAGRRMSYYHYRDPKAPDERYKGREAGQRIELKPVTLIREQMKKWRAANYANASRTTQELLAWWGREGRERRLFFAQREAAETIIFLTEARADFLQGIPVPRDEPGEKDKEEGYTGFRRYACKMATGSGKTTVMGMLAAWSILNKVSDRSDKRFSDVVLIVCPNVTIRRRLAELDPRRGDASLYRTRDLVPPHLMPLLARGRVVVTNWHVFEAKEPNVAGERARVLRMGKPITRTEKITIGEKSGVIRGARYLTLEELERQIGARMIEIVEGSEKKDRNGALKQVDVKVTKYVESDAAVVARVLGRDAPGKKNILVFNDEAHHAYRIRAADDAAETAVDADADDAEETMALNKEATVWVRGLDRVNKIRGLNFCVDLSATPYYLGRIGPQANRIFPWVVSDFSLPDAIESGLVKIPQLAVRDTTGADVPGYFNIWKWILPQLTPAERGGKNASVKPEAILKYAHHPIAMLAASWEKELVERVTRTGDPRPPVFILVCKSTPIAKVVYEWIAEGRPPFGIPKLDVEAFRNRDGELRTLRVDSKVVNETDTGEAKDAEVRWMRITLDTVGSLGWPLDQAGRPIYPEGFEELARELGRPLDPPGRGVRCIVSVSMLTEGWDCTTVTHIIGLRPFTSQLLCEQVVGRGLRRLSYEPGPDGKLPEEVAKVFGVPFEIVPYKASRQGPPPATQVRRRVHALPERAAFAIAFPRVDGYTQAIRSRIAVDWDAVAPLYLDPGKIAPQATMKASLLAGRGRPSLLDPGATEEIALERNRRMQALVFDAASDLTKSFREQGNCSVPPHVLFPQVERIVAKYVRDKVKDLAPYTDKKDVFLAPYYGWLCERLVEAIRPDTSQGEAPEVPRYETRRGLGSTADVDFWTVRDVREVVKSHVNFMVADTGEWEQSAAYFLDRNPRVAAFVKNAGLGFAIPYLYNGQMHDYLPDFLVRLAGAETAYLILEVKGWDRLEQVKSEAAERWVKAVNVDGKYGWWAYAVARKPEEVLDILGRTLERALGGSAGGGGRSGRPPR
jgi:type III restriction enzyme